MRHTFLTVLLTLGLVGGLASGITGCCRHRPPHNSAEFEAHVADVCVRAAERAHKEQPKP